MRIRILYIILGLVVISSCERNHSRYQLHEAPEFDESYHSVSLEKVNRNIEQNSDNPENYYRKAIILNELGRNENALINLRKAISLKADEPVYHYMAARENLRIGDVDEAESFASEAERLGEQSGGLFYLLSEVHRLKENYIKAADYINKAMKKEPENPAYLCSRGYILLSLEDTLAAEQDFLSSLNIKEDPGTYSGLIDIYLNRNDLEKTAFYLEKQLVLRPDNLEANLQMASLLKAMDYPDSAASLLGHLTKRFSEDYRPKVEIADYLMEKRQYDSALYYVDDVLASNARNTYALLQKARILNTARRYGESVASYTTLLDVDSTNEIASSELADLRRKIAYLQQLERRRRNTLPTLEKKDSDTDDKNN
ncbi:tetratricopeptide repeat protein [Roseivirga sp. BDSF3-8]|uniref:tetratricopeptide repeat protein n=1 Tax=Roseivirga sp. BDSF3-8 TaxID=3241598 RepID=UPI003532357E